MRGEIRKDYLQEKYVLIAPTSEHVHNIERPELLHHHAGVCEYCPHQADKKKAVLVIGPEKRWHVKVIADTKAALRVDYPRAYGRQEIIIETPNHILELDDLPVEHIALVLEACAHRAREITRDKRINYLMFAKNGGRGHSTLAHAVTRVYAANFVPPDLEDKIGRASAYKKTHASCPFCDVITKEQSSPRLIAQDQHMIAFAPYASTHNYEAWILPKRHATGITKLTVSERESAARLLKLLLRKISDKHLPYHFSAQEATGAANQHFMITVRPRGQVWTGIDPDAGLPINPIAPESAAAYFRQP